MDVVGLTVSLVQPTLDRVPRTHVLGLFLDPKDFLRVLEGFELAGNGGEGPRVELLDPGDRDLGASLVAFRHEVEGDLPGAEHDPLDPSGGGRIHIAEEFLERARHQIADRRARVFRTQQRLRGEDDERGRHRLHRLAPHQMEELGGGGRVADLDVVLGREDEELVGVEAGVTLFQKDDHYLNATVKLTSDGYKLAVTLANRGAPELIASKALEDYSGSIEWRWTSHQGRYEIYYRMSENNEWSLLQNLPSQLLLSHYYTGSHLGFYTSSNGVDSGDFMDIDWMSYEAMPRQ